MAGVSCALNLAQICSGPREGQQTIGGTGATASESAPVVFISLIPLAQACSCESPSGVDSLEQPSHVLAEGFHRAQGFFVLLYFAFGAADADVPVTRARNDHLADQEEVVE